jgi:glucokinase
MLYAGFDIGGTKCAVALGRSNGTDMQILERRELPTPGTWIEAMEAMFLRVEEMQAKIGEPLDAAGFSCGGPLDAEKGVVMSPPNLPGWDGVPVTDMARRRLGVPAFLENDANACALAEWRWGAGRGSKNMAFLTFGTGLGAGLILDGRLYRGTNGNAGEIGHMRLSPFGPSGYGKEGSFEGFCSGGGVAQIAVTLGKRAVQNGLKPLYYSGSWDSVTTKQVAIAAQKGDPTAIEVFEVCGTKLGEGLSLMVDMLNPECIVIGSVFARCEKMLRPAMERALARESLRASLGVVSVVPAKLGESIGDYAALCVAEYGMSE